MDNMHIINYDSIIRAYERLAVAIMELAIYDYETVLTKREPKLADKRLYAELVKFFNSPLYELYSLNLGHSGEDVMRAVRLRVLGSDEIPIALTSK